MSPTNLIPRDLSAKPIFIIVMGVSGTGKSTLGNALATALSFPYVEGDDLHPVSNVAKMSAGTPLTDADREPWLALIRNTAERLALDQDPSAGLAATRTQPRSGVVISSSALKRYYREILRGRRTIGAGDAQAPPRELATYFVFIEGPREVLVDRMEKRPGHFMKASMLDSQLNTLESPVGEEGVVVVSLRDNTEEQVRKAVEGLGKLAGYDSGSTKL